MQLRLPSARRYDRNCVLAATAGQVIAAKALGLEVAEIVVGESPFKVGKVAKDIRLAKPGANRETAIVVAAGTLGFAQAAGLELAEIRDELQGEPLAVLDAAISVVMPWIEDGRFARLVRALDAYQFEGRRPLQ